MTIRRKAIIALTFAVPIAAWLLLLWSAFLPAWICLTMGVVVLWPLLSWLAMIWQRSLDRLMVENRIALLRRPYQGSALATMYRSREAPAATSARLSGLSATRGRRENGPLP